MARLPYLQQSDVAPENRDLLEPRSLDGTVPNLYRVLAHGPAVMRKQNALAMHIRHDSRLDPRLRELAILQVGYMTKQPYEYSHHVKLALQFRCTEDDIRALADETAGKSTKLDPLAKLVLKAAREMTADQSISDATFAALRQHLDNDRLMELIIAVATYNGVIRILNTLQIDVEDEYQPYLKRFPLPA
jgi:alkylhydroperoxidase family enzyme